VFLSGLVYYVVGLERDDGFRGYYGLHRARLLIGGDEKGAACSWAQIVEGEFDALSSIAQQLRVESLDTVVLAGGGGAVQSLDSLATYGLTRLDVIADNDQGGVSFVEKILESTKSDKLALRIFDWPTVYVEWRDPADPHRKIKDPDDAIVCCGYQRWRRVLSEDGAYDQSYVWIAKQALGEISKLSDDDLRGRHRVAVQRGSAVRSTEELLPAQPQARRCREKWRDLFQAEGAPSVRQARRVRPTRVQGSGQVRRSGHAGPLVDKSATKAAALCTARAEACCRRPACTRPDVVRGRGRAAAAVFWTAT
jgi:hypothetical protein